MYNAIFVSDDEKVYKFGVDGQTAFDMDIGSGISIDIGTSQGFLQIGETVENFTISGRPIEVKGAVFGNIIQKKEEMRGIFTPFASGKLIFQDKYYIRVYVKETPNFSTIKNDGRFTMVFFAPYPFFKRINETVKLIGEISPLFSFPVNYSEEHKFGGKDEINYVNFFNEGEIKAPFNVTMKSTGISTNPILTNLKTSKFLKLNGELHFGEVINIYRDKKNILKAELISNGETIDIISWIDEKSELFELNVGENLILATDDEGGANLISNITFSPVVVAIYEN